MRVLVTQISCGLVAAPSAIAQSRGELLYSTHCIACHTSQMHWRTKRSANSWAGLKIQVQRWQQAASLSWSDDDIVNVSRYLNDTIYRFEQTADAMALVRPAGFEAVAVLAPGSQVLP